MRALSRDEIRCVEKRAMDEYGVPEIVLMENAGRGAAELLLRIGVQGRVVICCGRGNNGGDGLVIARHLDNQGAAVHVVQFGSPETPASQMNDHIVRRSGLSHTELQLHPSVAIEEPFRGLLNDTEWVVDALFGTGLRGPLRTPFSAVVSTINASLARVLAVDIPSGLDSDTGVPVGACVRAQHTATFLTSKVGFANKTAAAYLGDLHIVDIGIPRRCLEEVNE
jgi:NAD(P)H-hydrate epimerase